MGDRHPMPLFTLHYLPEVPMSRHWYVLDSIPVLSLHVLTMNVGHLVSYHFHKIPVNLPRMGHRTGVVLGRVLETASSIYLCNKNILKKQKTMGWDGDPPGCVKVYHP